MVLRVESAGYSLPPPTTPAGLETQTHDLRVTSLTLYPLGHDCPKLLGVSTTMSMYMAQGLICIKTNRYEGYFTPFYYDFTIFATFQTSIV